jgi:hypothetical protein
MEVIRQDDGLTYKRAGTAAERARLDHEAAVLRRVAHPGVVQLVGTEGVDPPDALVLRTLSGGDLAGLGAQPVAVIAGLGAALATTVADLHAVGFSHGGIEAAHVLLDESGRPVLCSLGRAEQIGRSPGAALLRGNDVRALATMLLQLLRPDQPARISRTLRGAAGSARPGRRRDARWLADQLSALVPQARLPDPNGIDSPTPERGGTGPGRPRPRRRFSARRRLRLVGIVAGVCTAVAVSSAAVLIPRGQKSARPPIEPATRSFGPTTSVAAAGCPPVDDGCVPVAGPGGLLITATGRYQVDVASDVVVVGRWLCGPTAYPAVLRPGSGDIWIFYSWPSPGHPLVGRFAGRVPAARTLQVQPEGSGCDRLQVVRPGLPPVTIPGSAP